MVAQSPRKSISTFLVAALIFSSLPAGAISSVARINMGANSLPPLLSAREAPAPSPAPPLAVELPPVTTDADALPVPQEPVSVLAAGLAPLIAAATTERSSPETATISAAKMLGEDSPRRGTAPEAVRVPEAPQRPIPLRRRMATIAATAALTIAQALPATAQTGAATTTPA